MEQSEKVEKPERMERLIGRSMPERRRKRKSADRLSLTQEVVKSETEDVATREVTFTAADHELAHRLGCPVEALVRKRSSSTSHLNSDARKAAVRRVQSIVDDAGDDNTEGHDGKMCTAHCELVGPALT